MSEQRMTKEERHAVAVELHYEHLSPIGVGAIDRLFKDAIAADAEIASLQRDVQEWKRVAVSLREQVHRYEDYLRNRATCPCCEEIEVCDEECTFAEDCYAEYESMEHVRDLLFPSRKG